MTFHPFFCLKKKENWEKATLALVTPEQTKTIEKEGIAVNLKKFIDTEYFYKTDNFIHPQGKIKERVAQFERLYSYEVFHEYQKDEIINFYNQWRDQKERADSALFYQESDELFFFCLDNLEKYEIRQIYIEANGKLIGLAWGVEHPSKNWVGIHMKTDYSYKGLSRFLQKKRAELFEKHEIFSLGTSCHEDGLKTYKQELRPIYMKDYYYLSTGEKNGKN
ncbi:MAG: hypothetical protein WC858_02320 [Parcubacteria group bacterium]|jgi:hypothetical protein